MFLDRCRVDVSPTENSWMLRPLNKASLGYCVPDRCVPTLYRIKQDPRQLYACPLGTDETCPTYPDIMSAHTHRPHHPCTASFTHEPHNEWVSRPRSWVKLGARRAPSLTATSLLAGLNAWTASSMPGLWPLQY
jgi:hypothetical protein